MRNRTRYAKNFKKRAQAAKEAVGWQCTKCGALHGSKRYSRWVEREVTVYLQAHHINHDPENEHAELDIVCPRCHYRVYHQQKGGPPPAWLVESLKHRKLIMIAYLA
jgi:DNA-directed RNA polymerase subunit RPC12/RpoP